ncbi:uncharacterized protein LOC120116941 [Hibiscus syriacus]|uniref:uncharacterized protein LOC120116941 n=1 Tax=Hibiscus syriacus TaxID=106335 RepID=UPI001923F2E2|nr:uncharacterized protein LOC120116941 [Hibiscus syriacus]
MGVEVSLGKRGAMVQGLFGVSGGIFAVGGQCTGPTKSIWLISVAAALWGVWLARNEMVFENKSTSQKDLLFYVKMMTLIWIKEVNDSLILCEENWWNDPTGCVLPKTPKMDWQPPAAGLLKFNIDGAFRDSAVGCGGALRDNSGNIKAIFSGPREVVNSDFAEVVAIKTVLELFLEIGWHRQWELIIKSDSQVALNWVGSLSLRPCHW